MDYLKIGSSNSAIGKIYRSEIHGFDNFNNFSVKFLKRKN